MTAFKINSEFPVYVLDDFDKGVNIDRVTLETVLRNAMEVQKERDVYACDSTGFSRTYNADKDCYLVCICLDRATIEKVYPDFFKDFSTKLWADVRFGTLTNEMYEREVRDEE